MRLATYNIWNDERGGELRRGQIIKEILAADADVIGLQEVDPGFFHNKLVGLYPYAVFRAYEGEDEGLTILSKHPILEVFWLHENPAYECSAVLSIVIEATGKRVSVTNMHLPWDSALQRERQIVAIDRFIHEQSADRHVLLGDFNGSMNSSVHCYLLGEQSLLGREANPCWFELSSAYAALRNEPLRPTLDFASNPRWGGRNTIEVPMAADRIYVMNEADETKLWQASIFGTAVSRESGYAASDHYGLWADVEFG